MNKRKKAQLRRGRKTRARIAKLNAHRLSVHRTPQHMYAQVYSTDGTQVLAAASTVEKELRASLKVTGNVDAAKKIGELIAKRAKEKGVSKVAFDRSGLQYHGRVKALAEAAREGGLEF
ncbi:MAG: 50S ribosomal protein L18 [Gammaproteobacteria bacterium]